jgi:L-asparaginase/Glu-tRNA(Gln) amidotransferase subunit D
MAHRTTSAGGKHRVAFFKIGGTWDMVKEDGKLIGSGGLDDTSLAEIEQRHAKLDIAAAEDRLCEAVESSIQKVVREEAGKAVDSRRAPRTGTAEERLREALELSMEAKNRQQSDISERLPWVSHINTYIEGSFFSLFSGDSSHLRASLIAPFVHFLLHYANDHPDIQVLGAQGTDTADLTILPFLDAFLFDTELLPVLFTGANRTQHEWNSDAPKNFFDLFQLAGAHLPAGSYWVFGSHLYRSSDMLKIDPTESRRIENFTTFFSPRLTSRYTKKVIGENSLFNTSIGTPPPKDHPIHKVTTKNLLDAINAIETIDLGSLNPVQEDVAKILDPTKKAIVIAAFALGNANNHIKHAVVEAVKNGKTVLVIDKSLLGVVNMRYAAGLMWANSNELAGSKHLVLSGQRMNKATAKAILTRALIENYDQHETQALIIRYCESRQLLEQG